MKSTDYFLQAHLFELQMITGLKRNATLSTSAASIMVLSSLKLDP